MLARQALCCPSCLPNLTSSLLKGRELEFQNVHLIFWESPRLALAPVNEMSYLGTCGGFAPANFLDWGSSCISGEH